MNANDKWRRAFEPEVPDWDAEEVWQRIEQELPGRRRRLLFWWWFAGLGLLLLLGGVVAYVRLVGKEKPVERPLVVGQLPSSDSSASPLNDTTWVSGVEPVMQSRQAWHPGPEAERRGAFLSSDSSPSPLNDTILVGNLGPVMQSRKAWHPGPEVERGDAFLSSDSSASPLNDTTWVGNTPLVMQSRQAWHPGPEAEGTLKSSDSSASPLNNTALVGNTSPVMQSRKAWHPGPQAETEGAFSSSDSSASPLNDTALVGNLGPVMQSRQAWHPRPKAEEDSVLLSSDSSALPLNDTKRSPFLSLTAGIFYTNRTLTARSPADQNYANAKKQSEQPLETIAFTGLLHIPLGRHLEIGTGLNYQRSAQWFRGTTTQTTQQQVSSDSATYYNVNGITHYESGYLLQETTTTRHIQAPGVQERWSVPVQLAWRWQSGRGTLGLVGGALCNFHSGYRGYALDSQLQVIEKEPVALRRMYRSGGVHSAYVGLDYGRTLGQHWTLHFGLRYQADLDSALRSETGLGQRDRLLGGVLGIGYKL